MPHLSVGDIWALTAPAQVISAGKHSGSVASPGGEIRRLKWSQLGEKWTRGRLEKGGEVVVRFWRWGSEVLGQDEKLHDRDRPRPQLADGTDVEVTVYGTRLDSNVIPVPARGGGAYSLVMQFR